MPPDKKQRVILGVLAVLVVAVWTRGLTVKTARPRGSARPAPVAVPRVPPEEEASTEPAAASSQPVTAGDGEEWGESPFLVERGGPKVSPAASSGDGATPLTLQGILWDAKSPSAVINGEVVGVGDSVGAWQVVEIQKDRVVLSDGASTQTLTNS